MSEQVMEVLCIEREGPISRKITETRISLERLKFLWEKMKEFDVLFNDFTRGDVKAFFEHFIQMDASGDFHPTGLMWDVDDVGIFFLNEIRPLDSAEAHFFFWDERFFGREELCRKMLKYVFEEFRFQRIGVQVPIYADHTLNAVERIGFVQEGRIRRGSFYKGKWFDVNVYGVLPEDIDDSHKPFKQKLDARFICPECGNRLRKGDGVRHGT